jgi:thiamine pyrophosphate-dependent acetolactate synthase large subunit-like protein
LPACLNTPQAFYLARTGRPGPVLVDVPKDIQQQLGLPDWDAPMAISGYMSRLPPPPEPAQLAAVLKALKGVKKPVSCAAAAAAAFRVWYLGQIYCLPALFVTVGAASCSASCRPYAYGLLSCVVIHRVTHGFAHPLTHGFAHPLMALVAASAQIVYLGGGALDSATEVREFISRTGIPVVQTLMGLGTFPVDDPLSLQMLGMHGTVYANYAVDQVG